MRSIYVLIIGLFYLFLTVPLAWSDEGPYFRIQSGATWLDDMDGDSFEIEFDTGYNIGAAVGYDFGQFRAEGEIAFAENNADKVNLDGVGQLSADGDARSLGIMANGYWNFLNRSSFTPYVGAGLGLARVSINDITIDNVKFANDDDIVYAYQLIAGLNYPLSKALLLDFNYRYFAADDSNLENEFGGQGEIDVETHNVSLGLRLVFQ